MAIYGVYLYVAGWGYLYHYFHTFNIDPTWLDFSLYDVLTKGADLMVFGWKEHQLVYGAALVFPFVGGLVWVKGRLALNLMVGAVIFFLMLPIYFVSGSSGAYRARYNAERRPPITFEYDHRPFIGRLLYFKSGTYYIYQAHAIEDVNNHPELSIYRANELTDVKVATYK